MMKAGESIGLRINTEEIKYMTMTRKLETLRHTTIGNSQIEQSEQIRDFKYLGVTLDKQNNMHGKINIRLTTANRCYFALAKLLRSKLISIKTKELYISYVRPVLSYACATWATMKGDEEKLLRFKRKILRKIHGPIYSQEEQKWK